MLLFLRRLLTLLLFMAAAALMARMLFEFIPGDKARLVLGEQATEAEIRDYNRTQEARLVAGSSATAAEIKEYLEAREAALSRAARQSLGEAATDTEIKGFILTHDHGLPLLRRLGYYLRGLARLDLGNSDIEGGKLQPVTTILLKRLPATMKLAFAAGLVGSLMGLGAALAAARWPAGRLARLLDLLCALGLVLPSFVLGPLLIWLFAVVLGWLPSGELHGIASYPLPVLALSAGFAAYLGRFGRTLLLHEAGQDYCRAARARGLSETAALVKHALPNAAIPLLTAVTLQVAALLGGAILTEVIFRWPGIGELTVNAVQRHDLDLVAGIVMWGVLVYTLMVGVADFIILAIDPVSRDL